MIVSLQILGHFQNSMATVRKILGKSAPQNLPLIKEKLNTAQPTSPPSTPTSEQKCQLYSANSWEAKALMIPPTVIYLLGWMALADSFNRIILLHWPLIRSHPDPHRSSTFHRHKKVRRTSFSLLICDVQDPEPRSKAVANLGLEFRHLFKSCVWRLFCFVLFTLFLVFRHWARLIPVLVFIRDLSQVYLKLEAVHSWLLDKNLVTSQ